MLQEYDKNMLNVNLDAILDEMTLQNGKTELLSLLEGKLKQLNNS
jgi:hypothetical protein